MLYEDDPQPIVLSHPVAERVEKKGLKIAELVVWGFRDGLYKSPPIVGARTRSDHYQAVALAQSAIMEVLSFETGHEWDTENLQLSIPPYWGKHPDKKTNKKINKQLPPAQLPSEQRSILLKGLNDLLNNHIIKLSVGELEIDPLAFDFDPMSGEAVNELR